MNYEKYKNLTQWLKVARAGEAISYHDGLLMMDRQFSKAVDITANKVMGLYAAGVIDLLQDAHGDGSYTYLAVMRGNDE